MRVDFPPFVLWSIQEAIVLSKVAKQGMPKPMQAISRVANAAKQAVVDSIT
jgi:hypothetical protein